MTIPETTQTARTAPAAVNLPTEKAFAVAEVAAPLVTAAVMPFLDPQAATTVSTFLAAPALVAGATFTGLLSDRVLDAVPGGDILRAHRRPFFVSTVATATAAATATLQGMPGIDALLAGWMNLPSLSGLVSLAWWGSVGFVGFSLRRVLGSSRPRPAAPAAQPAPAEDAPVNQVLMRWHVYISDESGAHPGQHLTLTGHGPEAWEGIIEAAPGRPVTVTADTVSGVYRIPAAQISITDGPHTSSRHILVHLVAPTVDQPQYGALETLWLQRVARKGGCMPGTHLEGTVPDPATGGVAAWICADEDTDALTMPDLYTIAGALRTTPLLVSVERTDDPRKAVFRMMDRSPLEDGRPLPGPKTLLANANGFVQLGTGVSGKPSRIQLYDADLGARHVLVAGVTGSGKGGVLLILGLSYHVNGVAIIYADPKGSSNPDVEDMAAYAGCGPDGAMGALRLAYAVFRHRVAESQELRAKNFTPTPERPYVVTILDEMAQLLGDKSPYRAEAAWIIAILASQGRSLGMPVVLCGQILNLDQMGSDTSIRDNVFYGGALVLLRSDSAQKSRVDLPPAFNGIDPSQIPAYWKSGTDSLIYDPTVPEDDPRRTFGVGYLAGPDDRAEMMRAWLLSSAAGLWNPDNVAVPHDFPGWEDRDAIATTPVGPAATDDDEDGGTGRTWMPASAAPSLAKEPTAEEKILAVLEERRDPIGLEIGFLHLDQITDMTSVTRKTVENTCSRLTKKGALVRKSTSSGEYGLPLPDTTE
ncbi:type IV secretory system conjugative DNA transfer family protein [Kitasatospora sp. NPDC092286]|uniref:type IV secretory system conjugative DNA transfer family protein n=1 Tax=Kitasatospora sp. NPDC092286 TaxID=3364087 RepID=UPI0037FB9533